MTIMIPVMTTNSTPPSMGKTAFVVPTNVLSPSSAFEKCIKECHE